MCAWSCARVGVYVLRFRGSRLGLAIWGVGMTVQDGEFFGACEGLVTLGACETCSVHVSTLDLKPQTLKPLAACACARARATGLGLRFRVQGITGISGSWSPKPQTHPKLNPKPVVMRGIPAQAVSGLPGIFIASPVWPP